VLNKQVLKPGQFATCRPDVDKLMLWSSYDCEIDDVNDTVDGEELFIILDVALIHLQTNGRKAPTKSFLLVEYAGGSELAG